MSWKEIKQWKEGHKTLYKFECACGEVKTGSCRDIRKGRSKMCRRCSSRINNTQRISMSCSSGSGLYTSWRAMKDRCSCGPDSKNYKYYAGRGIKVCDEWLTFATFRDWALDNGWKEGLVIDRINSEASYTAGNCHWITQSENLSRIKRLPKYGYYGVTLNNYAPKSGKRLFRVGCAGKYLGKAETALQGGIIYDNYVIENNLPLVLNGVTNEN